MAATLTYLRETLARERDELRAELGREREPTDCAVDIVDLATDRVAVREDAAVRARRQLRLEQVAATLERIDAGVWGRCDACEGEIGAQRLHVLPTASTCVRCAATR